MFSAELRALSSEAWAQCCVIFCVFDQTKRSEWRCAESQTNNTLIYSEPIASKDPLPAIQIITVKRRSQTLNPPNQCCFWPRRVTWTCSFLRLFIPLKVLNMTNVLLMAAVQYRKQPLQLIPSHTNSVSLHQQQRPRSQIPSDEIKMLFQCIRSWKWWECGITSHCYSFSK